LNYIHKYAMEIISRSHAKSHSLQYYFTGLPCKQGHISKRRTSNSTCYECELLTSKRTSDPLNKRLYDKQYQQTKRVNWFKQTYYPTHKGEVFARSNLYRAKRLRATVSWYDLEKEQIEQLYEQCRHLSKQTGVLHHVDHIVPLNNEFVCGLHCLHNLQIITGDENLHKSNSF